MAPSDQIPRSPYEILGTREAEANDQTIHKAYLNRIKASPPDKDPEGFRQIRAAYERLKDETARLEYHLFHLPPPQWRELQQALIKKSKQKTDKPTQKEFNVLLKQIRKNYILPFKD
ncbi:DnaJ domain-containing protein [Magnetococcales bacterium HHB-1]